MALAAFVSDSPLVSAQFSAGGGSGGGRSQMGYSVRDGFTVEAVVVGVFLEVVVVSPVKPWYRR